MIITAPITDYIPASTLTTLNDLVIRGVADPERYPQLSAFYGYRDIVQTITTITWTLFGINTELFDTNNEFNVGTHMYTPNRTKYLFVSAGVKFTNLPDAANIGIRIYKDAAFIAENIFRVGGAGNIAICVSTNLVLTNAQTLSVQIFHSTGADRDTDLVVGTNWLSIIEIPVIP